MSGIDFSNIPAGTPPAGVTPNFIDPPSQANIPRIITYVTLPPMLAFLALRFYTRIVVTRKVVLDDYLCLLAAATIVVYTILVFTTLGNPAGRHMWDVPVSELTVWYVKISVVTALLLMVASIFVKTSILALYQRIFSPARRSNLMILAGMAFTVVFYLLNMIILAVYCTPKSQDYAPGPLGTMFTGWLSTSYSARCSKYSPAVTATLGVVGAVLDLYILVIPIFFVWELNTSSRRKAGLAAIFVIGASALVFSIIGAYYRFEIIETSGKDQTWATMPIYGWRQVIPTLTYLSVLSNSASIVLEQVESTLYPIAEINMGILCSCIPVVFVLFKDVFEKSSSWASQVWYHLTTSYRRGSAGPSGASREGQGMNAALPYRQVTGHDGRGGKHGDLPRVPKATMTGLRSFLGRVGRTGGGKGEKTGASGSFTDDLDLTVVSVDYDYHRQLRAGSMDKRPL